MPEHGIDPLSIESWALLMGKDLPKARREAIQPVLVEDGKLTCSAGHVRHRCEPGTRVGFSMQEGRILLGETADGVEVRDEWHGHYEFALPEEVLGALPANGPFHGMLLDGDGALELVPMRVEEHGPDVLGPRVVDEVQPGALVRHVVKGLAYDEVTPERLRELGDLTCAEPFATDPVSALADRDDWIGWKVRSDILRRPAPGDDALRERLAGETLSGQDADGSFGQSPVKTAYAIMGALSVHVPAGDARLRKATEWLLAWPEPSGRPGMWMHDAAALRAWNETWDGECRTECGSFFDTECYTDADYELYRCEEAQQVWPTCCRNFHPVCYSRMLHPSATVVDALCRCGYAEHPRVRDYANSILQLGGTFGYFCACWGIADFDEEVEHLRGAAPDFNGRTDEHAIALAALPYGYGRDAEDICALAYDPNYTGEHRPNLADTNGWVPYDWREIGADDSYAVVGAYWQNADCWAKTNRALAQLPEWSGSIAELFGLFQCRLYQTSQGEWGQGYPAGILRLIAEMTRTSRARCAVDEAPALRFAKSTVLRTVPWLRRHQGADGLWDQDDLSRHGRGELNRPSSPALSTYHIVSALHEFGLLDRLRP